MSVAEEAQSVADYWEGHPNRRAGPFTPAAQQQYQQEMAAWENKFAPKDPPNPPSPPHVPGPPAPGAGMPAARAGDLTNHGGTIGPVTTGVAARTLIADQPAACLGDPHLCPMVSGTKAHVGGSIISAAETVYIGDRPAARVFDGTQCTPEPGRIAQGAPTVLIGNAGGSGGGGGDGGGNGGGDGGSDGGGEPDTIEPDGPTYYAETAPAPREPGDSAIRAAKGEHWIELEMVDELQQPVVGEPFRLTLPDGKQLSGALDAQGRARITGIERPGRCQIKFPKLDLAAWERWTPASKRPAAADAPAPSVPESIDAGPVAGLAERSRRGTWRTVRGGECISSIAHDVDHFWRTLWDHPLNAEIKRRRLDPNVLLPGDAVFVPHCRPKSDSGQTDMRHRFLRRGESAVLRLVLEQDDEPLADCAYTLTIDGIEVRGTTDPQGRLEHPIAANARRGRLRVDDHPVEYALNLGDVDPISELSGVQQRLHNLGFECPHRHGRLDERTRAALRHFQRKNQLRESGEPDQQTRDKLLAEHGS